MTKIIIFKNQDDIMGFELNGHAGYAEHGKDIVCSAISILVINAINSVEKLSEDGFKTEIDEKRGYIRFHLDEEKPCDVTKTILESLVLGLDMLRIEYGKKYIKLEFKEV